MAIAGDAIFAINVVAVRNTPNQTALWSHLMSEKITWDDAEKIGVLLARKHPELYPLSTSLEELHRRVVDLAEFADNSEAFDSNKLELIRAAWNEEFLDRTQLAP